MVFSRHAIFSVTYPGRERALRRYEIRWNYRHAQRLLRMARHPEGCDCPGHQFEQFRKGIVRGTLEWGFGWGDVWDDTPASSPEAHP